MSFKNKLNTLKDDQRESNKITSNVICQSNRRKLKKNNSKGLSSTLIKIIEDIEKLKLTLKKLEQKDTKDTHFFCQ